MIIRNEKIEPGVSEENTFVARGTNNEITGVCTVTPRVMTLFSDCPRQYVVNAQGDKRTLHVLYGAAIARAKSLAMEAREPGRIYAEVRADDLASLEVLRALGFRDGDGVVRMFRPVTAQMNLKRLPSGCTVVRDFLADPTERQYFLERYNACYGLDNDDRWLADIAALPDFARILMVSPNDLCGELLVWSENGVGVIGIIQTARKWRRKGVASYLIEDARLYFSSLGLQYAQFDVWLRAPGCRALARSADYTGSEPLMLYPEMLV